MARPNLWREGGRSSFFSAATHALASIYKAHKWFLTRGDLDYTALWILYAATPLARIEVIGARQLADREVIPQAIKAIQASGAHVEFTEFDWGADRYLRDGVTVPPDGFATLGPDDPAMPGGRSPSFVGDRSTKVVR